MTLVAPIPAAAIFIHHFCNHEPLPTEGDEKILLYLYSCFMVIKEVVIEDVKHSKVASFSVKTRKSWADLVAYAYGLPHPAKIQQGYLNSYKNKR